RGASFALSGRGGRRAWTGVCARIAQTHRHGEVASFSLTLAPALWLLSRRRNYRVFQHLSVPSIAEALLTEWGLSPIVKLDPARYPKLEYRVQYGETDYNFLRRQLAEAGISFYFTLSKGEADPRAEETRIVLTDTPEHGDIRTPAIPFLPSSGLAEGQEHVSHLTITSEIRPGRVVLRDHDPRRPSYALMGQYASAAQPEALLEDYVYAPGTSAVAGEADGSTPVGDLPLPYRQLDAAATDQARILGESLRPGGLSVNFTTSVVDLQAGSVFVVAGHPHPAITNERGLLVIEMGLAGDVDGEWSASGVAVPATEPFRPPLPDVARPSDHTAEVDIFSNQYVPQKPRVPGLDTATVVGPAGEEIHTDELGRIRVQFHWDREGQRDEHSSCWIRLSQAWAGAAYGTTFIPRMGQEVLVSFLGGDPDLPIVTGSVHAPTIPFPHALPEHKTKCGIRSSSTPGGGGYNEIMLDDAKGRELVSMRAERDLVSFAGRMSSSVAGETLRLFIADSQTGIEMSKGKIVLTTGEASIVLEGGAVSVHAKGDVGVAAANNLASPAWKDGAAKRDAALANAPPPRKLPLAPSSEARPPCVKLGVNKQYKGAILEASRRTGVAPYAIASMIDAEAAKSTGGVWNPASKATTSSAMGLTQFLKGTWKEMALRKGTMLNQIARDAGYVEPLGNGFEVQPGKLDDLLALRSDPDISIVTGAEYAKGNLDTLERAGFITSETTDDERARLAYLAHHEGPQGAKDFLRGTIPEARAAELLSTNAGKKTAAELTAKHGNARAAYTHWLNGYVSKKIVPSRYRCSDERVDGDQLVS
ncbi:MAG: type VI secretion system tip protein VgrG, partial [Myxococcales bacterium]|nr:type VI secretion system tip protein VgrG [Myxococcales bacterium]